MARLHHLTRDPDRIAGIAMTSIYDFSALQISGKPLAASFCKSNYSVSFSMLVKLDANGAQAAPYGTG